MPTDVPTDAEHFEMVDSVLAGYWRAPGDFDHDRLLIDAERNLGREMAEHEQYALAICVADYIRRHDAH